MNWRQARCLGRQRSSDHGRDRSGIAATLVWPNHAARCVVGAAAAHLRRFDGLHRLFHLGGISRGALLRWTLPFPVLLARAFRRVAAQLVWAQTGLVARWAAFFARAPDPVGARPVSPHLLLLSRRVLQIVLGRPARLHGWRAAKNLPGRTFFSAHPAKRAPLLSVPRTVVPLFSCP